MKEKGGLSSSASIKEDVEGFRVTPHRRTSSFSSFAKVYRSPKNEKSKSANTSSNQLNTSFGPDDKDIIAILEHEVSEGKRVRQEMALEIARLKDLLQQAEDQIAFLKQENSTLQRQVEANSFSRPLDVQLCLSSGDVRDESVDTSGNGWSEDPLNATIYAESMHDDSEHESDFSINTIINNINVNTYNTVNTIHVSSVNEINHLIDINNKNNTAPTNTNSNATTNNSSPHNDLNTSDSDISLGSPGNPGSLGSAGVPGAIDSTDNFGNDNLGSPGSPGSPDQTRDGFGSGSERDRRARLFSRATSHHKRRGSDTDSCGSLDEKYQRRNSEGKVLRIAVLQEQIRHAVLQILNSNYGESEDEWPAVHRLLQGVEVNSPYIPPPPRHLVHAGFLREGDRAPEGYWIDDVLLLLFKDFFLVACQPKTDLAKAKYQFKEVFNLTPCSGVRSWATDTDHYGIEIATEQHTRSFLTGSKDECDKWISVISKQISALSISSVQESLRYYLIAPCDGFVVEPTTEIAPGETKLCLEEPRKGIYHYQSFFYSKSHINFVGGSSVCPVAISIEDKSTRFALSPTMLLRRNSDATPQDAETVTHRALVRTQSGDECVCIAISGGLARSAQLASAEILTQLPQVLPSITFPQLKLNTTIFRVKSTELESDLLQYEADNMRRAHKIGIVYCAKGARTEAEMLQTTQANASADFHQFLSLLGQEVVLKSWTDYSGGLDTKEDADGTHSLFTNFWGIPVMFHVSTLLRNDSHNPNVSKKRHIGNDIVVIVFKDHDDDALFVPSTFKSHLNHIFCVVQHVNNPDGSVSYKVSFCAKEGVGGFLPALPSPPIFTKDAKFKHFLLAKVVNAERAAMRSAPFAKRHALARLTFLKNLWRQYNVQPKEDDVCNQINTL